MVRSSSSSRSRFASTSMAAILPPVTVKAMTDNGPPCAATTQAAPLSRAGRASGASRPKVIAWLATLTVSRPDVAARLIDEAARSTA